MTITYSRKRLRLSPSPSSSSSPPAIDTPPTSPSIHQPLHQALEQNIEDEHEQQECAVAKSILQRALSPTRPTSSTPRPPPTTTATTTTTINTNLPTFSTPLSPRKHTKRPKLSQSTLNFCTTLSAASFKTCPRCGMHYNKTQPSDRKLHDSFCARAAADSAVAQARLGVKVAISALQPAALKMRGWGEKGWCVVWRGDARRKGKGDRDGGSVLAPGRRSEAEQEEKEEEEEEKEGAEDAILEITTTDDTPKEIRQLATKILRLVEAELGAAPIPENELFPSSTSGSGGSSDSGKSKGRRQPQQRPNQESRQKQRDQFQQPIYTFHLYLHLSLRHGVRCVGLCLNEGIDASRAFSSAPSPSSNNTQRPTPQPQQHQQEQRKQTLMGITRIWTASSHRNRGIGLAVLDAAFLRFKRQRRSSAAPTPVSVNRSPLRALSHGSARLNATSPSNKGEEEDAAASEADVVTQPQRKDQGEASTKHISGEQREKAMSTAFSAPTTGGARLAQRWTGASGFWVYV